MPVLTVDITLSAKDFLKYYQGVAQVIVVRAISGERVQLPASALRSFVTNQGIYGRFEVFFTHEGKLEKIVQQS